MTTAMIAEGKIDAAITTMVENGFRLKRGCFGNSDCGCAVTAFASCYSDRKPGESVLSYTARVMNVHPDVVWEFVYGFDGKHMSPSARTSSPRAIELREWYEAGQRLAQKWVKE